MRGTSPILILLQALMLLAGSGTAGDREGALVPRPFGPARDGGIPRLAICYGPHRDGRHPGGPTPSRSELLEDLRLMAAHWKLLRVYGAAEFAGTLLELIEAEELDLVVMLGIWIAPGATEDNEREVEAGIRLAKAHPGIVAAVCVGNETQVSWSAHRIELDAILDAVRRVRSRVPQPVTVADDFSYWIRPESRALAAEIDFITFHAHPMWNGIRLDGALDWLRQQVERVEAMHAGRPALVGETGWATSVHDEGEQAELIRGRPGEEEQRRFYRELSNWTADSGRIAFVFEAFDENWKGGSHPDEVEKHWGLFRADRSPKAALRERTAPTR